MFIVKLACRCQKQSTTSCSIGVQDVINQIKQLYRRLSTAADVRQRKTLTINIGQTNTSCPSSQTHRSAFSGLQWPSITLVAASGVSSTSLKGRGCSLHCTKISSCSTYPDVVRSSRSVFSVIDLCEVESLCFPPVNNNGVFWKVVAFEGRAVFLWFCWSCFGLVEPIMQFTIMICGQVINNGALSKQDRQ